MESNDQCVNEDGDRIDQRRDKIPRQDVLRDGIDHEPRKYLVKRLLLGLFFLLLEFPLFEPAVAHFEDYNDDLQTLPI